MQKREGERETERKCRKRSRTASASHVTPTMNVVWGHAHSTCMSNAQSTQAIGSGDRCLCHSHPLRGYDPPLPFPVPPLPHLTPLLLYEQGPHLCIQAMHKPNICEQRDLQCHQMRGLLPPPLLRVPPM